VPLALMMKRQAHKDIYQEDQEDRFSTLLKALAAAGDPESAQAVARQLADLILDELPEYAGDFLRDLKACTAGPAWKREQAADIAEVLISRLYEPRNPISPSLKGATNRLLIHLRGRRSILISAVGSLDQLIAIVVLALLWPYGQLFKAMAALLRGMEVAKANADFRVSSTAERFPL
jgi:hypothetical protein